MSDKKSFSIQEFKSRNLAWRIIQLLDITPPDSEGIKKVAEEISDGTSYLTLRQAIHFVNKTMNCSFEMKGDIVTYISRSKT